MRKLPLAGAAVVLTAGALALAGCGSSGGSNSAASSTSASTSTVSATPATPAMHPLPMMLTPPLMVTIPPSPDYTAPELDSGIAQSIQNDWDANSGRTGWTVQTVDCQGPLRTVATGQIWNCSVTAQTPRGMYTWYASPTVQPDGQVWIGPGSWFLKQGER